MIAPERREGVGRGVEALLVGLAAVVATVTANRDQIATLTRAVPGDLGDPLYFAWQLAWVGHALRTDPGGLWTTNAFQRAPDNLAFTDTVLGYAPLSLLVPDGQAGAIAQLNLAGLVAGTLATIGGYVLARVLGARIPGALVAGAGFGFAPWRLTHVIHINVLSTGGIALTLALLAYGHAWSLRDGWQPDRIRPGWAFAGWLTACWQLGYGFATGIWFTYSVAIAMGSLALGWLLTGRRRLPTRLLVADAAGGLILLAATWLLVQPYLRVLAAHPGARRVEGMLELFSPSWSGLLTAPDSDWFWADRQASWRAVSWPPEMLMSPGILLLALAVAGLFLSSWSIRRRLAVGAITAALVVLSMGTTFPGNGEYTYVPLYHHLPGWENLRTPGRLMIWVTLGLCVLAAGAVSRICDELALEWRRREEIAWAGAGTVRGYLAGRRLPARAALGLAVALPALLVVGEGINITPHYEVSRSPIDLRTLPQPLLLLPSAQVGDYHMMLWSTEGWPVVANGDSGFDVTEQNQLRAEVARFPDAASLVALRRRGIATVVVVRSRVGVGQWADAPDAPVVGLDVQRRDEGDAVVFDVR